MVVTTQYKLTDFLVTINSTRLEVNTLQMTHSFNESRVLNITTNDPSASTLCSLGSEITVVFGHQQIRPMVGRAPHNDILTFRGIIKAVYPKEGEYTITAFDFLTHLATSEQVDFTDTQYYKGWDGLAAIRDVVDNADVGIDTSAMITTSATGNPKLRGGVVSDDWNIYGWKTRKEFIDGIIANMKHTAESDSYRNAFDPITFNYAIMDGVQLRAISTDILGSMKRPVLRLTDNENVGIVASTNLSKMVNSCTVRSTLDSSILDTYENQHSIKTYGIQSAQFNLPLSRKVDCTDFARSYVEANKEPTITYTIELQNFLWFDLGNYIELEVPSLKKGAILPIAGYSIRFGDTITTTITMGENSLTPAQILKQIIT